MTRTTQYLLVITHNQNAFKNNSSWITDHKVENHGHVKLNSASNGFTCLSPYHLIGWGRRMKLQGKHGLQSELKPSWIAEQKPILKVPTKASFIQEWKKTEEITNNKKL